MHAVLPSENVGSCFKDSIFFFICIQNMVTYSCNTCLQNSGNLKLVSITIQKRQVGSD